MSKAFDMLVEAASDASVARALREDRFEDSLGAAIGCTLEHFAWLLLPCADLDSDELIDQLEIKLSVVLRPFLRKTQ